MLPLDDGIGVKLQACGAIFQIVFLLDDFSRKLAGLACRNETASQAVGQRTAKDESARLNGHNRIDFFTAVSFVQFVDDILEGPGLLDKRSNIAKHLSLNREIRHVADKFF